MGHSGIDRFISVWNSSSHMNLFNPTQMSYATAKFHVDFTIARCAWFLFLPCKRDVCQPAHCYHFFLRLESTQKSVIIICHLPEPKIYHRLWLMQVKMDADWRRWCCCSIKNELKPFDYLWILPTFLMHHDGILIHLHLPYEEQRCEVRAVSVISSHTIRSNWAFQLWLHFVFIVWYEILKPSFYLSGSFSMKLPENNKIARHNSNNNNGWELKKTNGYNNKFKNNKILHLLDSPHWELKK